MILSLNGTSSLGAVNILISWDFLHFGVKRYKIVIKYLYSDIIYPFLPDHQGEKTN